MLLFDLVQTSKRVAETPKRLKKVELLAALISRVKPDEAEIAVAFLCGRPRQGNIGIGYATLSEAKAEPSATPVLQVMEVDRELSDLAAISGSGSERRRREALTNLFRQATTEEQDFLRRLLTGELRQGALEGIAVDALAKAAHLPGDQIRRAAMMAGGLPAIAQSVLEHGAAGLAPYTIQLLQPVQPMLAQTADDVADAVEDLGEAALEYKFDGARVQVHKAGDEVRVYSRRLNEVTGAVPEIVEAVRGLPARDLILDGEVLSLTPDGRPQPFQVTMRRFGRKLDVNAMRAELPLTPFWFDLLYLDGGPLIDEEQRRRFDALKILAPAESVVPHLITGDSVKADEFLAQALSAGHEGVMAKATGAPYAAGARGQSWLKVKKARTLDLVILAAEWGNGRRKGWLSNLHLGARDALKGGFAMLGKTFKGLTDQMLQWQTEELLKIEIARDAYTVYVAPKIVVEIAFNEIQVSPTYASGLALRFARVKRYRPDKNVEQSDTYQTVQRLAGMVKN